MEGGEIMKLFSQAEKELWLARIWQFDEKMELCFDDQECLAFFTEFACLRFTHLISEVEAWLLEISKRGDLPIVFGLLAYWYVELEDWENSQDNVLKASRYFPDTDFWQELFDDSSFGEFLDQEMD